MNCKSLLAGLLFSALSMAQVKAQVPDSAQIKYDNFVSEKKSKAKNKYTYSQFAIALRYRDTLGLNTTQVNALYVEVDKLKQKKQHYYDSLGTSIDTRSFESERMTELLSETQYTLLLRLKNHTKALSNSNSDWTEIVLRGLDNNLDPYTVKQQLYDYYITRESIYDRYRHIPMQQNAEARALYASRPAVHKALSKSRRSPANDTLGENLNGN